MCRSRTLPDVIVMDSELVIGSTLELSPGVLLSPTMFRMVRFLTVAICLAAVGFGACTSPGSQAPELTAETESDLAVDALVRACDGECAGFTIYVHDELFTADTPLGQAEPMPQSTIEAIRERLGDVTFVNQNEADTLFGDDALVDSGNGVLISIGPVEELAEGVVGVEVGLVTARDGGHGQVLQFQWSGEGWTPATSDENGVTVTSWVS